MAINHDDPHYVYRCYADDGTLLYVGMTKAPTERLRGHRSQSWWFGQVSRYSLIGPIVGEGARHRARAIEAACIKQEQPKFNGRAGRRLHVLPTYEELPAVIINWAFVYDYLRHTDRSMDDLAAALRLRGVPIEEAVTRRVDRRIADAMADALSCRVGSLAPELAGGFVGVDAA